MTKTLSQKSDSRHAVRLGCVSVAVPELVMEQAQTELFLSSNFADQLSTHALRALRTIHANPSILRRRFALDYLERLLEESPDERIARFTEWGVKLGAQAAQGAMAKAGLSVGDISAIIVNTCTGYICPGLSTYLVEKMGLPRNILAFDLVGSGCGGAIPNLQMSNALLNGDEGKAVLSISVEICSATFQMAEDMSLIVSNALFADGAAACVLWRREKGLHLIGSGSIHVPEHREAIRYIYRNGQLHNQLSPRLPALLKGPVFDVTNRVMAQQGLRVRDVRHWAIHPGGKRIIEAIKESLGLTEEQLAVTRGVLADYGNTSSPSVLFGLERVLGNGIEAGDWCMMVSAGAGLSAHAFLFRA